MDLPFRKVASNLNLGLGTVHKVYQRFIESGSVQHKKQPKRDDIRVLSHHQELLLNGMILENPSLYFGEMCQQLHDIAGLQVSAPTICRVIRKHGFTRKKIKQIAKQRKIKYRGQYMAEVQLYKRDQCVH